jgi:hypothetical protein
MDSNGVATDLQFLILQRRDLSLQRKDLSLQRRDLSSQRRKNEDNRNASRNDNEYNRNASRNDSRNDELRVNSLLKSYIDTQFLLIEYSLQNLKKQGSTRALNEDEGRELEKCEGMFSSVQILMGVDKGLGLENAERVGRVAALIRELRGVRQPPAPRPVERPAEREDPFVAELKATLAKRNARAAGLPAATLEAAGTPLRGVSTPVGACFQILNPYVV